MSTTFYKCNLCGNVILKTVDSGAPVVCCGHNMEELVAQTSESGKEKHLPVVTRPYENIIHVSVGSVPHPMTEEHFIRFIYLETENGGQIAYLTANDAPKASFCCKEKPTAVYEYCNLHGLWKTEL